MKHSQSAVLIILLLFGVAMKKMDAAHPERGNGTFTQDWSYDENDEYGPSRWEDLYPQCAGNSQSPINLKSSVAEIATYDPLTFTNFDEDIEIELDNNGHSAQLILMSGDLYFEGGGLSTKYKVARFHFHWGSVSGQGSEHEVDGVQYDAEMHIVGWDSVNYDSINDAQTEAGGLAVLGILVQEAPSSDFKTLTAGLLEEILYEGSSYDISSGTITLNDFLPDDTESFYRYNGSLTTPSCYESVYWTVFTEVRSMAQEQLNAFRALSSNAYGNVTLEDNYRTIQDLNSRSIYLNEAGPPLQPNLLLPTFCFLATKYFIDK